MRPTMLLTAVLAAALLAGTVYGAEGNRSAADLTTFSVQLSATREAREETPQQINHADVCKGCHVTLKNGVLSVYCKTVNPGEIGVTDCNIRLVGGEAICYEEGFFCEAVQSIP